VQALALGERLVGAVDVHRGSGSVRGLADDAHVVGVPVREDNCFDGLQSLPATAQPPQEVRQVVRHAAVDDCQAAAVFQDAPVDVPVAEQVGTVCDFDT